MPRAFRESPRSATACANDTHPKPTPRKWGMLSTLPPWIFVCFVPLFCWGGVPFFRMWERLAAFVGTFHSYLKKALSPDNNTLARGVPKGLTLPVSLLHSCRFFPWGILPPAPEWGQSPWGTQGGLRKVAR